MGNRLATLAVASIALSGPALLSGSARADEASPADIAVVWVNEVRSDEGRSRLQQDPHLSKVARRHAKRMADDAAMYHNGGLEEEAPGYRKLGENVGIGASLPMIHEAFLASDTHRGNILATWHVVGIGVVERSGEVYTVQVFGIPEEQPAVAKAEQKKKPKKDKAEGDKPKKPKKPKKNKGKKQPQREQQATTSPSPSASPSGSPSPSPSPSSSPDPAEPSPSPEPSASAASTPQPSRTPSPGASEPSAEPTAKEPPLPVAGWPFG